MAHHRSAGWLALAAFVAASVLVGCDPPATTSSPSTSASSSVATSTPTPSITQTSAAGEAVATGDAEAVRQLLNTLPVKGRAPKTGYERSEFGTAWKDVDHNGCDTRNDILARDLTDKVYKPGTHDCVVASGVLHDPYTGTTIHFTRGQNTSTAVQIDHVVALSDAWQKGAQQLSADLRTQLANDPLNLLAVDGPTNQQKSDGDAATWLPPNKAFRCTYVTHQVQVKAKYSLWVTQAEKAAITNQLGTCS
ncbi:HNH endonuclease [Propionibacterium freudenreichii]|uniref:HNH endonuclease family protein n=1 Tax=Propionibacterium freudenreichii TaxID=1744 RepID=UPI0005A5CAA8|nr:HNH endonuclease family protein [Propionibacterium freudenreichii]MDK9319351.1 HNH endonuclease [Propionibacterium freudenreichii]MDK9344375.1 HNH endonuclease [Propionibacterium freudenreichii]MDK9667829.1 HNH endonuclease [Propionibacterium freudenreichii]CEI24278.1 Hypothetical secreted protein [Propionibacterium freudenreichii]